MSGTDLSDLLPQNSYKDLMVINSGNTGLPAAVVTPVGDGDGNNSPLELSQTAVNMNRTTGEFQLDGVALTATAAQLNAAGGANDAQYIVVALDGDLPNERVLTGTADQITLADGGANGNMVLSITTNPVLPGTGSVTVPIGTTAQRPGTPVAGMERYNSTTGDIEFYIGAAWQQKQPLDGTLTSLAAYNTNGLIAQTAADTFAGRTLTAPAAGITVSNGDGVAGNPTLALANDLAGVEGLAATGLAARTGDGTWSARTLTAPAAGITVSDGDGVAGNPTLVLANDLAGVEGLGATGLAARTGDGTWSARTLTAPAAGITVSDGDGVAGNPTLVLANDLAAYEGLGANGMVARTGDGTASARTLTAPAAGFTITDGDGVAGNPTFVLANDLAAYEGLAANGMVARTGDGTASARTITGTSEEITVSNGDGVAGNPTLSLAASIVNAARLYLAANFN